MLERRALEPQPGGAARFGSGGHDLGRQPSEIQAVAEEVDVYVVLIIIVVLAVPAVLGMRLAAAKRREQRTGSPSTFTEPTEPPTEQTPRRAK